MLLAMSLLRLKHWFEYVALLLFAGLLRILPYRVALAFGWLVARLAFHLVRFRRREAVRRIEAVFGDGFTPRQRRQIAWLSLRNLFFNMVELMRAAAFTPRWLERHVENYQPAMERVRQLVAEHGGVILALPHLGNWDLAGIATHHAGIKIFSVAGVQRNRLVNDWLNRQRGVGLDILPRGSAALRQVVKRLRNGQVFAILPDVRTRQPDLAIPFLGGTANLGRGMAQFARLAAVPILPVAVRRIGWARHRFDCYQACFIKHELESAAAVQSLTEAVMQQLEAAIRATPGEWFWYNKRWVLEPLEANATIGNNGETAEVAAQQQEPT